MKFYQIHLDAVFGHYKTKEIRFDEYESCPDVFNMSCQNVDYGADYKDYPQHDQIWGEEVFHLYLDDDCYFYCGPFFCFYYQK